MGVGLGIQVQQLVLEHLAHMPHGCEQRIAQVEKGALGILVVCQRTLTADVRPVFTAGIQVIEPQLPVIAKTAQDLHVDRGQRVQAEQEEPVGQYPG